MYNLYTIYNTIYTPTPEICQKKGATKFGQKGATSPRICSLIQTLYLPPPPQQLSFDSKIWVPTLSLWAKIVRWAAKLWVRSQNSLGSSQKVKNFVVHASKFLIWGQNFGPLAVIILTNIDHLRKFLPGNCNKNYIRVLGFGSKISLQNTQRFSHPQTCVWKKNRGFQGFQGFQGF